MQVTRKDISETKVKLTIELGLEELTHSKQHELQEKAKTAKITGFRKGKAPLNLIEKQLDQNQLQADVINHAINDYYGQALSAEKLRALDQPNVTIGKFVPYTELQFTAEVEIMPKIKLGDYKKIKKSPKIAKVEADEVKKVLANLSERMATKKDSSKPAKLGDDVVIDFDGKDKKGQAVAGASGKDYSLNLGSNSFIPGFEDGLVGSKSGDKKELKLKFPKDYHAENLAGTDIVFEVQVKKVQSVELPKLDDEFAKKVGPFDSFKSLQADIKTQLEDQKKQEAENALKDEIVEELVKKSTLVLPDILINDQISMLEHDFNQNLIYRGITKEEYIKSNGLKNEEEWRNKELRPQAERRVSVGMILAEVADVEGIKIDEQELADRIELMKIQYKQNAEQFDTPEMQREVASRLITEKTVDRLVELAGK
ncbi:trigger factor [Candidatus Nomurabacteria bacterium]|nr:trigger factor [Candidatus Nomurabacteria bacterium]